MTIIATVRNGQIELPAGVILPEGAELQIEVAPSPTEAQSARTDTGRRLLKLAGSCEGLPDDLAANVDHYLYGAPKR